MIGSILHDNVAPNCLPLGASFMLDEKKFFSIVRNQIFSGRLTQEQVNGIQAVLRAANDLGVTDLREKAYILATPMIETGGTFVPGLENLNYKSSALISKFRGRISIADANKFGRIDGKQPANQNAIANIIYGGDFGRRQLGNTQPGDGWRYRGRGLVQITGRRNYDKLGKLLGINLVDNPELATHLDVAAKIMVVGMSRGAFTGVKTGDYFKAGLTDWINARRTVNGTDRASDIATFAKKFYAALQESTLAA